MSASLMPQQTRRPRSMYFKKFYKVLLHQLVYIWGEVIWQLAILALVSDSLPIKSKAKFDIAWYSTKFSELLTTIDWKRRHFTAGEYCQKTNTNMFRLQNFCLQKIGPNLQTLQEWQSLNVSDECCWEENIKIIVANRVAEVVRGHGGPSPKSLDSDENFKPEHTLFCPELRFVAIFTLFLEIFGHKKCLFG